MDISQESYGLEKEVVEETTDDSKLQGYSLRARDSISNAAKSEVEYNEDGETEDATDFEAWDSSAEDDTKSMICFYTQTIVILIIVVACVINMSLGNGDQTAWTGLLSTSLGIILPQPGVNWSKIKERNKQQKLRMHK